MDDITKEKRATESVLQVSRDWENIFQAIGHPTIILDAQHNILLVNHATVKAAGAGSADELIGRKCYEIFHNACEPPKNCPLVKMLSSTKIEESEMEVEAFGGIYLVSCTPVFDEKGELQKIIHIATDITERKRAEELIRMSEERFRTLFENIPLGTGVATLEGKALLCNEALANTTGYTKEEFLNLNVSNLYQNPEDRGPLLKQLQSNGYVKNYEAIFKRKNGIPFYVSLTINLIAYDGNNALLTLVEDITERKRSEEALGKEKIFSETMINSLPGIFYLFDENGHFMRWNRNYEIVSGYSSEEMEKMNPLDFFSGEGKKLIGEAIEEVFVKGESNAEANFISKDGRRTSYYFTGLRFISDDRPYLIGMGIDITERKLAEEALRESEQRLRRFYESGMLGVIYWNMRGQITDANDKFLEMIGSTRDDLANGRIDWVHMTPPEYQYLDDNSVAELKVTGVNRTPFEKEYIRKDGTRMPIIIAGAMLDEERFNGIAFVLDITERKRAEEKLLASEAELHDAYFAQSAINMILSESLEDMPLELLLQRALNMILAVTWLSFEPIGSIHIVESEPGVLVMKAQSNLPKQLKKLCAKVPFGTCLCGLAALTGKIQFADHIDNRHGICYEGMVPHRHYIVPLLFGGRSIGVIDIYLKEGHEEDEREKEFLRNVADTLAGIIARKQTEEEKEKLHAQLLQAQKMEVVGRLAGGIAHDFNNILAAMIGYGHVLKMKLKEEDPLRSYANHILSLSDKAADLTQSLLAFSRKQIINPRPVNLNEIIKRIDYLLSRIIGEDIKLQTRLSEEDLIVMADPGQIEQVLMNLATNARDAMPEGGFLTIGTEKIAIDDEFIREHDFGNEGEYALISLTDTGTGMDRETREKIFEPFFTTKEVGKGTGLGLSMVYGIIKQHEGCINVYSEPGSGTTFRIYLPLIEAKVEEIKPEVIQTVERGTETVLLAEDEEAMKEFTKKLLEEYGYKVITAASGQEAIDEFKAHKDEIQLLLFDVIMPNRNGKEAYEEIKKIRPDIKVLFMSGYPADIIHKHEIVEKGFAYIEKPASPTKLLRKIREVLGK
jgi:PAS domain S-box-containing protein